MALRLLYLLRRGQSALQSQVRGKITIQPPPHPQRSWPPVSISILNPMVRSYSRFALDKVEIRTPLHPVEQGVVIKQPETDLGAMSSARFAVFVMNHKVPSESLSIKLVRVVGAMSLELGDGEPVVYTVTLEGEAVEGGQTQRRFYRAKVSNELCQNRSLVLKDWCEWKPDPKALLSSQSQEHGNCICLGE